MSEEINLSAVEKVTILEYILSIIYYCDDGEIINKSFPSANEFYEAATEIVDNFAEINGIYYNPAKIEMVKQENEDFIQVIFYGGKTLTKKFEYVEVSKFIESIERSFMKIDDSWYNGRQLIKLSSDEKSFNIKYKWLNNKDISIYYNNEFAFERALEKIDELEKQFDKVVDPTFDPAPGEAKTDVPVIKGTKVSINCGDDPATIYYTTDKSTPTIDSKIYKEPIEINEDTTIKAVGIKCNSDIMSVSYKIVTPDVKLPEFNPPEGRIIIGSDVEITCDTEDATIYYTTDGTEPTKKSDVYKEPITVEKDVTIKAYAVKKNYKDSKIVEASYTVFTPKVENPVFNPVAGEVEVDSYVMIFTRTEGATIYYTTDGTKPSTKSNVYKDPIQIVEDTTIKAVAVKEGYSNSTTKTSVYTVPKPKCEAPIFNPDEFEVESGTEIVITASPSDAEIYYTTDGSEPDETSTLYKDPVVINENLTLKAIAIKKNYESSPVTTREYTIVEEEENKGGE